MPALSFDTYIFFKNIFALFPAMILVFTARGFCKAVIANLCGDNTAKNYGFLSFNPFVHIDPILTLAFILLLMTIWLLFSSSFIFTVIAISFVMIFGGNWIKITPINYYNLEKSTFKTSLVALSGSIGTFVLGILAFYAIAATKYFSMPIYALRTVDDITSSTIQFSAFLSILHLLPIPPLDGFRVFEALFPNASLTWREFSMTWAPLIIILLIFVPPFNILLNAGIGLIIYLMNLLVFI